MSVKFEDALSATGSAVLRALATLEATQRRLHPAAIAGLRDEVAPLAGQLRAALVDYGAVEPPEALAPVHARLGEAAQLTLQACERFCEDAPAEHWILNILGSMRTFAHALEKLYPLHRLPPVGRYFCEPPFHSRLDDLDPEPPRSAHVGLHATGDPKKPGERGGFCLYVPERYDESTAWPLVVCLHGGSGSGREYLWLWLREARGRGFLALAPTSVGPTWSMIGPDVDGAQLASMIDYVCEHWSVDRTRVLLTGLSDGATYGLMLALGGDSPFSAVAPIAGVLHPGLVRAGQWAAGKRVYLVHGALDWMFPVASGRLTSQALQAAGARLVYREIEDLSHTYPRDENPRILDWLMEPAMA